MNLQQLEQERFRLKISLNSNYGYGLGDSYIQDIYNKISILNNEIKEESKRRKREKKLTRIINEPLATD